MALNKAQLMDPPGGPGVIGAIKAGQNITISADGTISSASNPGTVTSVGVSTTLQGLTVTNSPITSAGNMNLQGVLGLASGGTGATTAEGARAAIGAGAGTITAVVAGTGLSGGGSTGSVTLNNTGVTSIVASTGIQVNSATGSVTVSNTGVTALAGSTGIQVSAATGGVTISFPVQSLPSLP